MGNILSWFDKHINRKGKHSTRFKGFLSYLFVFVLFSFAGIAISAATRYYLGEIPWIIVSAVLLKITFSAFSFRRHCKPIRKDLEDGNIEDAASKVQMIVSRNTKGMDSEHIASSCCETISENLVDSVFSPTFFMGLLGLPGAVLFRCANLMDAMWGYLNEKYGDLGYFPAKFDDILGFLTARISPIFVAIAAFILRMNWRGVISAAMKEHTKTPSPNSGWSMTATAAALGISMEKKGEYVMGTGPMPTPKDISRCYLLIEVSSIIFICAIMLPLFVFAGVHVQLFFENLLINFIGGLL